MPVLYDAPCLLLGRFLSSETKLFHDQRVLAVASLGQQLLWVATWSDEKNTVELQVYDSKHCRAYKDASDEVRAKAKAWLFGVHYRSLVAADESSLTRPSIGKEVQIVDGDLKYAGARGEVFWTGEVNSIRGLDFHRVGVRIGNDKAFFNESEVEVINPEKHRVETTEFQCQATNIAEKEDYFYAISLSAGGYIRKLFRTYMEV